MDIPHGRPVPVVRGGEADGCSNAASCCRAAMSTTRVAEDSGRLAGAPVSGLQGTLRGWFAGDTSLLPSRSLATRRRWAPNGPLAEGCAGITLMTVPLLAAACKPSRPL